MKKYLFFALLIILTVSFFASRNIRSIQTIAPEVLSEPIQGAPEGSQHIIFTKGNYHYELTPVYQYEISGLVVSKISYGFWGIYEADKLFPMDVCMIWGSNVKNGEYKKNSLKFSQDCRWCWAEWQGDVSFNLQEMSNNHLLVSNKEIEKKLKSFSVGDQVKIIGKLVNVNAKLMGKAGAYDPASLVWNTSTSRSDTGAGACEVIYVEDIHMLHKGNPLAHALFSLSFYALVLWMGIGLIRFFMP